jgi:chromate transporter
LVAVSVIAHAVVMMGKELTPDWPRRLIALTVAAVILPHFHSLMTLVVIAGGAAVGFFLPGDEKEPTKGKKKQVRHRKALVYIIVSLGLLILLPVLNRIAPSPLLDLADAFYRSGMLVFGGGHVVLPLLEAEVVHSGLVDHTVFLAGYGAAQALPGPLFAIAAFLGQTTGVGPLGIIGSLVAVVMIFLGSFLLMLGVLPWWEQLRSLSWIRKMFDGVNAAVVGLLAAVLINPIMITSLFTPFDAIIALAGFFILLRGWLSPLPVATLIIILTMGTWSLVL